jgi:hypothetical protein
MLHLRRAHRPHECSPSQTLKTIPPCCSYSFQATFGQPCRDAADTPATPRESLPLPHQHASRGLEQSTLAFPSRGFSAIEMSHAQPLFTISNTSSQDCHRHLEPSKIKNLPPNQPRSPLLTPHLGPTRSPTPASAEEGTQLRAQRQPQHGIHLTCGHFNFNFNFFFKVF